ncbi:SDR family NAD(P)-dependent oxidoreductase [Streptomyces sp. NPDC020792]|uniref:SDR family NAD(P)-dependent oxidoreductase n=1 Tax=Streptomyces sp. NPDC020792 TaxID=3365089 RepID=UPI0037B98A85
MTGRLVVKVAFITGAARGQGRSHAVRLVQEGADIIAVDICRQIESNAHPLTTPDDLAETRRLLEELGRRAVAHQADVREPGELQAAVADGVAELGRRDVVVANAGILSVAMGDADPLDFVDAVDVDLLGVLNTVVVSVPRLGEFASVGITGQQIRVDAGPVLKHPVGPGR